MSERTTISTFYELDHDRLDELFKAYPNSEAAVAGKERLASLK